MDLPDPYMEALSLIDTLLRKTSVKFNMLREGSNHYISEDEAIKNNAFNVCLSCKMLNLTLREINHFLRIFEYRNFKSQVQLFCVYKG